MFRINRMNWFKVPGGRGLSGFAVHAAQKNPGHKGAGKSGENATMKSVDRCRWGALSLSADPPQAAFDRAGHREIQAGLDLVDIEWLPAPRAGADVAAAQSPAERVVDMTDRQVQADDRLAIPVECVLQQPNRALPPGVVVGLDVHVHGDAEVFRLPGPGRRNGPGVVGQRTADGHATGRRYRPGRPGRRRH